MSTLIAVASLGVLSLLLEILNLRKILVPLILIGLIAIFGMTFLECYLNEPFIADDSYKMIESTTFSRAFSMLFIVLSLFIVLLSLPFYSDKKEKIADYISLQLFVLTGAIAMVSFGNIAMFFIGLEILSVGAYILAASEPKNIKSNEAGMKYFLMGAFASGFILFGIAMIYGAIGSFDVAQIIAVSHSGAMPVWFSIGFIMVSVGLFFKAGIVPFHFWSPDVYQGSPSLVTALMSTLVKVAALAVLFKVVSIFSAAVTPAYQTVLIILSIATMTVGNITALRQTNIKRMMAYSGISHAGFMMMHLLGQGSASGLLYYAAAYSLSGIAVFAVIIAVCKGKDNEEIVNFHGLAKSQPLLALCLSGALISLGGVPIFAGFFAKFFVFEQMLITNHLLLVVVGILNSIIAIYYYFGVVNVMFTKQREDQDAVLVPVEYKVVVVVAISLNILLGIFPALIMGLDI